LKTKAVFFVAEAILKAIVSKSELLGAFPSVMGTRAYFMGYPSASRLLKTSSGV
jgi:hypothetical protein